MLILFMFFYFDDELIFICTNFVICIALYTISCFRNITSFRYDRMWELYNTYAKGYNARLL
jgi:hypothetical protein